jgi:hypothetical protein
MISALKTFLSKPTPRMLLTRQLDEAERMLINYKMHAEYAAAMVTMSDARIARIKKDIQAMNQEQK